MRAHGGRPERGQSLVEMALVLPLLLALTVGLIDAGRAVYAYNAIARAAREGARYGAVYGGSQHPEFRWTESGNRIGAYSAATAPLVDSFGRTTIVGAVVRALPGLNTADVGVQVDSWVVKPGTTPLSPGNPLRVTVSYTFRPMTPFLSGVPFPLTSVATATVE